jgi:endonuclease YncB( thermonuclease family)
MLSKAALLWMLCLATIATTPAASTLIEGVASVIDGDTLEIHGQRIRLKGIDAPESGQTCTKDGKPYLCGKVAAFALADKIGRQVVTCEQTGTDRYKRALATCFLDETDLCEWMVSQGQALAFRKYSTEYVPAENQARAKRLGLWSGEFQNPWDWRKDKRGGW